MTPKIYQALICFQLFSLSIALNEVKSIEKDLIQTLINKYEHHGIFGRPVNNSLETIVIEHKLQVIQILDLDENRQILVTNCWSNLRWKDSLLQWDPKAYANITSVRVYPDHIWTPDIMLYNFADERSEDRRACRVTIYSSGLVLWVPQSLYKSSCSVEITYFPFDTQNCKLEFGSLAYDNTKLDISWWITENKTENYIDYADYMPSNEWEIYGSSSDLTISSDEKILSKKIYRFSQISDNEEKLLYPVLRYILRLNRNPSFYLTILIVPCTLLSLLTLVIFWLPPESPAKLMLGISIFVAFFVLLLLLADFTPREVKNFPLIGAYFCLNMMMITSTTFLATLIINIHFKGSKSDPIPKFIRRLILEGLGQIVLVRKNIDLPIYQLLDSNKVKKSNYKNNKQLNQIWTKDTDKKFRKKVINSAEKLRPDLSHPKSRVVIDEPYLNAFIQGHLEFERDIREISRYIRIILNREKMGFSRNLIAMEYRTLALVLDRLFFILYLTTMATAVIVCYSNTKVLDFDLSRNISNR